MENFKNLIAKIGKTKIFKSIYSTQKTNLH